jgi:hypothetical protein
MRFDAWNKWAVLDVRLFVRGAGLKAPILNFRINFPARLFYLAPFLYYALF